MLMGREYVFYVFVIAYTFRCDFSWDLIQQHGVSMEVVPIAC